MFGIKKEQAAWEIYATKYIEGVERLHKIGGFQLVVFTIGITLVLLAALLPFTTHVANYDNYMLPYLELTGGIISICGIALHVFEVRRKSTAYQKALDNYYSMTAELWKLYIKSLSNRDVIDSALIFKSLEELNALVDIGGNRPCN